MVWWNLFSMFIYTHHIPCVIKNLIFSFIYVFEKIHIDNALIYSMSWENNTMINSTKKFYSYVNIRQGQFPYRFHLHKQSQSQVPYQNLPNSCWRRNFAKIGLNTHNNKQEVTKLKFLLLIYYIKYFQKFWRLKNSHSFKYRSRTNIVILRKIWLSECTIKMLKSGLFFIN